MLYAFREYRARWRFVSVVGDYRLLYDTSGRVAARLSIQFPVTLLSCGLAELGADPAGHGFGGLLALFRPE
jgi:hypothetical protein